MPNPLLTGDSLDPRFDPPTQEEQDYWAEHHGYPDEMPQWLDVDQLEWRGGGIMGKRAA